MIRYGLNIIDYRAKINYRITNIHIVSNKNNDDADIADRNIDTII